MHLYISARVRAPHHPRARPDLSPQGPARQDRGEGSFSGPASQTSIRMWQPSHAHLPVAAVATDDPLARTQSVRAAPAGPATVGEGVWTSGYGRFWANKHAGGGDVTLLHKTSHPHRAEELWGPRPQVQPGRRREI